jgi:hypothetical protein
MDNTVIYLSSHINPLELNNTSKQRISEETESYCIYENVSAFMKTEKFMLWIRWI